MFLLLLTLSKNINFHGNGSMLMDQNTVAISLGIIINHLGVNAVIFGYFT